ncbi:PEBP family protein [Octadecabacter sp. G9-8]|uniref:PEBP family protein n=1 Tax=Octadecabacter dasysiphoniae TaxID=2909341 RepID=A0ABS9CVB1_9RHOB|nr:PEBP family protein [Octadecabacter dasysiphoniae]MCF2870345.1 PEBP family protein [Octadecabacter dasysiphoniae]
MIRFLPTIALMAMTTTATAETFSADVWADNWFEMRINGVQVAQDSVPITTERSFNAESFTFEAERPFTIGLIAKDFKENDTGLEYIGSGRQQMGDGGVIVQIMDEAGAVAAVSDNTWQCYVIHTAPLDKSCESASNPVAGEGACGFDAEDEPADWDSAAFDASDWPAADVYSANDVRPKDGYDRVDWVDDAQLIWGPDLEQSNTVLCRLTVQ